MTGNLGGTEPLEDTLMKFPAFLTAIATWIESWPRAKVVLDKSAWILIAPGLALLWLIDPAAAKTLLQWSIYGVVLSGMAVVISRLIFPQIDLSELVDNAYEKANVASAIIAAAVVLFVGILVLALVLWAKA